MSAVPLFELAPQQPGAAELEGLRRLLHDAHAKVKAGATPHEALWALWSGTSWPARLRKQAIEYASAFAHRDLDAICELFDNADRVVQRRLDRAGVSAFVVELQAQNVASETLARQGFRGPAVRLLTAHRAKGLEWKHVFVANVTESVWPDMRRRSALLDGDRLTPDGLICSPVCVAQQPPSTVHRHFAQPRSSDCAHSRPRPTSTAPRFFRKRIGVHGGVHSKSRTTTDRSTHLINHCMCAAHHSKRSASAVCVGCSNRRCMSRHRRTRR